MSSGRGALAYSSAFDATAASSLRLGISRRGDPDCIAKGRRNELGRSHHRANISLALQSDLGKEGNAGESGEFSRRFTIEKFSLLFVLILEKIVVANCVAWLLSI
ncbi:MAG: hypothetical protein AMJ65_08740 [Phycisphaerae bacterium SG8_4]|nr:MAG: hypothetical protein AMJ65_08740 [Phycisphaerae bacterium SG8_4]